MVYKCVYLYQYKTMLCAYFKPLLFHLHKDDTKDFLSSRKGVLDFSTPGGKRWKTRPFGVKS